MPPSFAVGSEQIIDWNNPEIVKCFKRFETVAGPDVSRIISRYSSFSEEYGFIVRIVYKAAFDKSELDEKFIYLCWKKPGGIMHAISSLVSEENSIR